MCQSYSIFAFWHVFLIIAKVTFYCSHNARQCECKTTKNYRFRKRILTVTHHFVYLLLVRTDTNPKDPSRKLHLLRVRLLLAGSMNCHLIKLDWLNLSVLMGAKDQSSVFTTCVCIVCIKTHHMTFYFLETNLNISTW